VRPLVSILVPAHNAERWLAQTLASALAQTWAQLEVIVVDDGSRDQTLAVATHVAAHHARAGTKVLVVHQDNAGASAARNHALSLAQGDFIQWLDADDVLHPDKLTHQMTAVFAQATGARHLATGPWGRFYQHPERAIFKPDALWNSFLPLGWLHTKCLHNTFMANACWLIPRALSNHIGGWDERLTYDDDGEYAFRLVAASDGVTFVPGASICYRSGNTGSLSWQRSPGTTASALHATRLSVQHLRALDDSVASRQACLALVQDTLSTLQPHDADAHRACHELAQQLGGTLHPNVESLAFRVARRSLGWHQAQASRAWLNQSRRSWGRLKEQWAARGVERHEPPWPGIGRHQPPKG
jgi:cellulose synthase/poly-beta-1,6-N-acetylglucosamine synthase-like glycosyltransferase